MFLCPNNRKGQNSRSLLELAEACSDPMLCHSRRGRSAQSLEKRVAHRRSIAAAARFLLFHFAGIWLSAFALGNFVGPTVAGLAVDIIGFRRTTIIFFALYAGMAALDAIEAVKQAARQRAASAYEELG